MRGKKGYVLGVFLGLSRFMRNVIPITKVKKSKMVKS